MKLKVLAYRMYRWFYKITKIISKIRLHHEYFYFHDLKNIPPVKSPKIEIEIRHLFEGDEKILHQVWPIDLIKVKKRLNLAHSVCYLTYFQDELIAYQWVQFKGVHYIQQANKSIFLKEKEEFIIYHARVKKEFQSLGINKYIKQVILQDFYSKGFTNGFIYTSSENIANQKGIDKLGFKRYIIVPSIQIGSKFYQLKKWPFGDDIK